MLIEASIAIFLPETESDVRLNTVILKEHKTEGNKKKPYKWPISFMKCACGESL